MYSQHIAGYVSVSYLLHQAHILSQPVEIEFLDGLAVQLDDTRKWIVPPFEKTNDGAFTGAALTL
jgi:hypothetical protein